MATKPRNKKQTAVATAVQAAHAALYPVLCKLQDVTAENVILTGSRSKVLCAGLIALWTNSTDRVADGIALLGDGVKQTKKSEGKKGSLADALVKQYGDELHVNVRAELARCRKVYAELSNPVVRKAADEQGLRAAYDVAKPKAKKDTPVAPAAPVVGTLIDRASAVLSEDGGFDAILTAVRSYFARAADSIGLAKLGELEVHLVSKTKKTG